MEIPLLRSKFDGNGAGQALEPRIWIESNRLGANDDEVYSKHK